MVLSKVESGISRSVIGNFLSPFQMDNVTRGIQKNFSVFRTFDPARTCWVILNCYTAGVIQFFLLIALVHLQQTFANRDCVNLK
jgi:hypothetical protein